MKSFNAKDYTTKELVGMWNAEHPQKPIKKFVDRKTAEKRVAAIMASKVQTNLGAALKKPKTKELEKPQPEEKAIREDGKYNRKNPQFETDADKRRYVESQYAVKTDRFPGRKSQFAKCFLTLKKEVASTFREGTVVENSFNLIATNPGIGYEEFRIAGGRNTDLKAMVDRGIVKVTKSKRK